MDKKRPALAGRFWFVPSLRFTYCNNESWIIFAFKGQIHNSTHAGF